MKYSEIVARNIRTIRMHHNHSVRHLARSIDVYASRISRLENLEGNIPLKLIELIAKYYDFNPALLFLEYQNQDEYLNLIDSKRFPFYKEINIKDIII